MKIIDQLQDKKIVIWGYGREGKSSERFIKKFAKPKSLEVVNGNYADVKDMDCDLILKSPGIVCFEEDDRITSQTALFVSEYKNQIIGITGTKGKSTTASMMHYVLEKCGRESLLVGNIGFPCLDFYDSIKAETVIVFEMSAHQLQNQKESPHIGVFLNLFEDHLDYYKTMDRYFAAKEHVVKYQKSEDYAILGSNFPKEYTQIHTKGQVVLFDEKDSRVSIPMKLQGDHNRFNASIVKYISNDILGLDGEKVCKAISSFEGLKHRLENIGVFAGITFYNDSISTICESTIYAVNSISNVGVVLIGGMDRGISYDSLESFIVEKKDLQFILMYETGKRIFDELKEKENCIYIERLEEAVKKAKEFASKGQAVVMSPAAASYGAFENFEHRGDEFVRLVKEIMEK